MLSGCSTIPSNAPSFSQAPKPNSGSNALYIYRLGAYPTLRTPNIKIDGKSIFDPSEGSYTWVYLPPGKHNVQVSWSIDVGWPDLDFEIDTSNNKESFLKISGKFINHGALYEKGTQATLIPAEQAVKELGTCCKFVLPDTQM